MKKTVLLLLALILLVSLATPPVRAAEIPAAETEAPEAPAAETEAAPVTWGSFLRDLVEIYETGGDPARIDADAEALGDPVAFSVAAHWKKVYLDPDYTLCLYGSFDPAGLPVYGAHAFVVLGYELQDGEMTDELKGRCDAAAAAAAAFPDSILVCSGGATGKNNPENHTEAGLMKAYLAGLGIAPERILTDENAMTTAENAINTFGILRERGIETMTLVTSAYHQRWGQVLYNALAALYRQEHGYSAEIVGNFCFDIEPSKAMYLQGHRIAATQLGRILDLPREELDLIPGPSGGRQKP